MRSFMYIAVTWKDPWAGTRRDIFQENSLHQKKKNGAQCFDIGDLLKPLDLLPTCWEVGKRNNNITSHRLPKNVVFSIFHGEK